MKLFPFISPKSRRSQPTLLEIALPVLRLALVAGAVASVPAISKGPRWPQALLMAAGVSVIGGLAWTALLFLITKIAAASGYRPYVHSFSDLPDLALAGDSVGGVLSDLGFELEESDPAYGKVWVKAFQKQEVSPLMTSNFPIRAYWHTQGLDSHAGPCLALHIKGTPLWDTGETKYLQQVGEALSRKVRENCSNQDPA